jgi:hypothetical protein
VPPVISYIGIGITLITFMGLAFVYLRGSADKGTIESQDRLIKAQGAELADLDRRVKAAEARVSTVEAANAVLRDAVGHTEEIRVLQTTADNLQISINQHHTGAMEALARVVTAIEGIKVA